MKTALFIAAAWAATAGAQADVVTDWNIRAGELIVEAKLGTPPANRAMALVQTAVHEAVVAAPAGGVDAAVAAANRAMLLKLLPAQQAAIDKAYQAALDALPEGPERSAGIAAGEQAAAAVLTRRAGDAIAAERYRPHAAAGRYVPTAAVAAPQWPQRKPWAMSSAAQFRPGPPPALDSLQWTRDYEEVRLFGAKASAQRSAEQTEVARFWEYSLPPIYHALLRSVANAPGRSVAQNARLFAAASQAMDDALIAVFDAKYHYNFWRPVTAIRNGDADGNAQTPAEPGWNSLLDSPLHPEYPSAHSVLAGALGSVLRAEVGPGRPLALSSASPSAGGATRRWADVEDLMREVGDARIWAGIHFRGSTEVGLAMGRQIGALLAERHALGPDAPRLLERLAARGVQIYECRADAAAPGGAQWVFVEPQAELFDAAGTVQGRHYAGPHWEAADGSKLVGRVESRSEAPAADAIPWLRLSARSVGAPGRLAGVTRIERVNTSGGLAPQRRCDAAGIGSRDRVRYTADYLLYAS
ncbi:DUF3455 domain-containing protein [Roseateles violae]|uniref:DUF3455 domain-containing protein n=1 Tax=Roseateles violae TaxID=3058042 RepID=A0ABT8DSG5_9BURK|nr:DUF3455 domain-containing protein [Pelomonas sp. PFR6]MDN3921267.1 DUF3455 domain-containing protein [Pelomonas sp. PFR6]